MCIRDRFARIAKGELVSREASAEMLAILRQQHYNTMLDVYKRQVQWRGRGR